MLSPPFFSGGVQSGMVQAQLLQRFFAHERLEYPALGSIPPPPPPPLMVVVQNGRRFHEFETKPNKAQVPISLHCL